MKAEDYQELKPLADAFEWLKKQAKGDDVSMCSLFITIPNQGQGEVLLKTIILDSASGEIFGDVEIIKEIMSEKALRYREATGQPLHYLRGLTVKAQAPDGELARFG